MRMFTEKNGVQLQVVVKFNDKGVLDYLEVYPEDVFSDIWELLSDHIKDSILGEAMSKVKKEEV